VSFGLRFRKEFFACSLAAAITSSGRLRGSLGQGISRTSQRKFAFDIHNYPKAIEWIHV
jgi:hypothetical protein